MGDVNMNKESREASRLVWFNNISWSKPRWSAKVVVRSIYMEVWPACLAWLPGVLYTLEKVCHLRQRSLAWQTAISVYFVAGESQSLAQEKRTFHHGSNWDKFARLAAKWPGSWNFNLIPLPSPPPKKNCQNVKAL